EPAHRPQVVPVGVDRARGVALVADRLRHEPEEDPALARAPLGGAALLAERLDRLGRAPHRGPQLQDEAGVARVPPHLHHAPDELALAVVLGRPVGAARIDAAGDAAVLALVAGVPAQEGARLVGVAEL